MFCKIEIVGDQMCVMDDDGNSYSAAALTSNLDAKKQIQKWAAQYTINVADAYSQLADHFSLKRKANAKQTSDGEAGTACGAVNQEALEHVIRENMSPEGVAALVMALQSAGSIRATTPEGDQAIQQVIWFHNTLLEMIGVETFNRTMDELGF
jgi:hypothetical protein